MPPWLYALVFISLVLMVGWVADRHHTRVRRGLGRPATARFRTTRRPHHDH